MVVSLLVLPDFDLDWEWKFWELSIYFFWSDASERVTGSAADLIETETVTTPVPPLFHVGEVADSYENWDATPEASKERHFVLDFSDNGFVTNTQQMPDSFLQDLPPVPPLFSTECSAVLNKCKQVVAMSAVGVIDGPFGVQADVIGRLMFVGKESGGAKYIPHFDLWWDRYNWLDSTFNDEILSLKLVHIKYIAHCV